MKRSAYLLIALLLLSALPAAWYFWGRGSSQPQYTLQQYLTAVYARDYNTAYQWISAEDREVKSREQYLRENPSFSGPALRLVRSLAGRMEINDMRSTDHGDKTTLRFNLKLPDASDPSLQEIFLDFDLDRINRLSAEESRAIEQQLKTLAKINKLPMLEGEEQWELVKEADGWRVFLNWAGATRVLFEAKVMEGLPWRFEPVPDEVWAKPGETLHAVYRVKNLSDKPITAKARHINEPKELASKYLEIVQCFCFIQQTLAPGEEKEFPLVFRVNWNVPEELKEFRVSYEFYPIDRFPEN
ncbi:MAG: cytochrome c oxidase assembly protein [Deltaproteobacteria bacterium]|nr:cytochrome c oxidase assembly protein [Deltaproteobacteria bacterium]